MKKSTLDGQTVNYTDALKLSHIGVIAGQSDDGKWYFVQSTNPKVPPAAWHFKVNANLIDAVKVSA